MRPIYKYLIVVVVSAILTLLIRSWIVSSIKPEVIERTITVYRDTAKHYTPQPFLTVDIPNYKIIALPPDTVINWVVEHSTDSFYIQVPITQKVYQDSTYTAFVSGYEPSLDSIFIYNKNTVITNTIYPPKNSLSPFISTSISLHHWDAKVGISLKTPISDRIDLVVDGGYELYRKENLEHFPFIETKLKINIFNW